MLALLPLASAPQADRIIGHYGAIVQMVCESDKGIWTGTAFQAGGHYISVAHVTNGGKCEIHNQPVTSHQEGKLDFSQIDLPATGYRINCGGFRVGEQYYAIGHANSLPIQRVIRLEGTGVRTPDGMAVLLGDPAVIPGMSGGPILNDRAEVVGTVNAYAPGLPISYSQELKGTSVCKSVAGRA